MHGRNRLTGTQKALERIQEPDGISVSDAILTLDGVAVRAPRAMVHVVRLRPSRPRDERSTWFLSPLVFLLAAAATFLVFYLRTGSVTASTPRINPLFDPRSASLDLRVDAHGPGLRISWNRYSPAVQEADRGVLAIQDGPQYREIGLDRNQIVNGSIVYRPASSGVSFRLDLRGPRGSDVAQIVRVLDASRRKPAIEAVAAAKPSAPAAAPETRKTQHELTIHQRASFPPPQTSFRSTNQAKERANLPINLPASRPTTQTASVPSAGSAPRATSTVDPGVDGKTALTNPKQIQSKPVLVVPDLKPLPVANPPQNLQIPPPAAPATSAKPLPVAAYVPPRPLTWVQPDEHLLGSRAPVGPVDIKVKIKIDETGHVTSAHALVEGVRDKNLLAAAAAAVRQWVFEPAKAHGTNVASEEIIVIHLGPQAQ